MASIHRFMGREVIFRDADSLKEVGRMDDLQNKDEPLLLHLAVSGEGVR